MAFGSLIWQVSAFAYNNNNCGGNVACNDSYIIFNQNSGNTLALNYSGATAITSGAYGSGYTHACCCLFSDHRSITLTGSNVSTLYTYECIINGTTSTQTAPFQPNPIAGGSNDQIGKFAAPQTSYGHGICCDIINGDHWVYVSDTTNHKVVAYKSTSGAGTVYAYVYQWAFGAIGSGAYQFNTPKGIAVDNTRLYVLDSGNNRVMVYAKSDRSYLGSFGGPGSGNSQFNNPTGIGVDPFYIYVLDVGNAKVKRFDLNTFAFVDSFGTYGTGDGQINQYSYGLAVNYYNSRIFIAEISTSGRTGRIQCFENTLPTYTIYTLNSLFQDAISGADISLTLKPQISAGQPYVDVQIKPTISAEGWGHMNTINQPMLNFLDIEAFGYEQSCNMIIKPSLLIGTDQILLSFFPEILIGTTNLNQALDFEFQAAAAEAITGEIDLDIKFQLTVAGPVAGNGLIEIELATDGFGAIDPHGTGVATLTLQAIGHAGSFGETTLPSLETSGFGYVIATGTGEVVISLAAVGTGIADAIATGVAVIEGLTTFSQGFISPLGSTEGIAFQLRASGVGYAGTVGRGSVTLPRVETEGAGYLIGPGTAAIEFTLIVRGTGDYAEGGQSVTLIPVMNTRNAAVTEFSLPLFDITEVDGHIYATDGTNVYELMTGTSDNSAAITSSFASAVSDTHLANVRLVREVYTNTRTTGPMSLTVTTDEGRNEYTYAVLPTQTNRMHGVRTKCGRGLRGRFLKLRYSTQASFELDKSRLLVEPIRYRER